MTVNDPTESWEDYRARMCRHYFTKDVAIVSVQLASSHYMKIEQTVYVTFVDKLAQFGKFRLIRKQT